MTRVGWYLLKSGKPYHGTIPAGADEIPAPDVEPVDPDVAVARDLEAVVDGYPADLPLVAGVRGLLDQLVETGESGGAVGSDVAGVDLSAEEPEQVEVPVAENGPASEDDVDGAVGGDAPKRTSRKRTAQGDG